MIYEYIYCVIWNIQGSTYLFEVPLWKFILSQPYVWRIKMKTHSRANFPSPGPIFLKITEKKLLSEATVFQGQLVFICLNSALLTQPWQLALAHSKCQCKCWGKLLFHWFTLAKLSLSKIFFFIIGKNLIAKIRSTWTFIFTC